MDRTGSLRFTLAVGALALVAACGGSGTSKTTPSTPSATNRAFTGALSTGDVLVVDVGTPPGALTVAATTDATVTITGTIALAAGGVIDLGGYYLPSTGAVEISGGPYVLVGTFANGALTGTFTVSGTPAGAFFAADSTTATVTTYCGTFAGGEQGTFVLLVSGGTSFATISAPSVPTLRGTASGGHVTLSNPDATMEGTFTTTTASGTFTHGSATGTWTATVGACPVPPAPVMPPDACTLTFDAVGAATVDALKSTAAMPTLSGGSIPSGTYLLSAVTYYGEAYAGPDSFQERAVIVVDGTNLGVVRISNDPSARLVRISGPFTTSGNMLSFQSNSCLGPPSGAFAYGMVGGELWMNGNGTGGTRIDKFTRVP